MDRPVERPTDPSSGEGVAEQLHWLLRLRWVVVPAFVVVVVTHDVLAGHRTPWVGVVVGGVLLLGNGVTALLLSSHPPDRLLLAWARADAVLVVALPLLLVSLHGDAGDPLRYAVLVGVVGATVVLPRATEALAVAGWAMAALVVADLLGIGLGEGSGAARTAGRWIMDAGVISTVATLAWALRARRDEASRKAAEAARALEVGRLEWAAAFDAVQEAIFVTDRDGRLLRVNRAFARLVGTRAHELPGRGLAEVLTGHPDRWWTSAADGIVEIHDPVFDTLFEVTTTRLGDRVLRVSRDVGEQKRLHARLVQADKLAAVGVLASGVAHEINNPTAFVSANLGELRRYLAAYEGALSGLSALVEGGAQSAETRAVLSGAELLLARREAAGAIGESLDGVERIRQIVTNLRSLARRDPADEPASTVDLHDVVETVVRAARTELGGAARLDLGGPVFVLGHRGELVDVVLNLVVNAVQAREEGRPNLVTLELRREGSSVVLRVSDTGRGIAPAHMKRLFEPFFTTKPRGEGTGLGLSLARKIVLAHGGSIDVASEVGVGSTFTVRLPAVDAETPAAAPLRPPGGGPAP
jgi:two-component system NtrC family sensor kinase